VADCRGLDLAPGRRLRTRVAGIFLFLPLLARLRFDQIVQRAGYPGSQMVPAVAALLSLLTLKLLDKERRSHISDFNFDEALGLFAGLNILPKATFAATRQLIAQLFPTADRSAFVAWDRQGIASFGVGPDRLRWHTGGLSLLRSTSTRSPAPTSATLRTG
jgi:hypothetical protein